MELTSIFNPSYGRYLRMCPMELIAKLAFLHISLMWSLKGVFPFACRIVTSSHGIVRFYSAARFGGNNKTSLN